MLSRLSIVNFALIDELDLEFSEGLNVLTGETGAGKSIIIDSIRVVLGDKMSSSLIRDTEKSCRIEAVFDIYNNPELLNDKAILDFLQEQENSLIIHRSFSPGGRNKTTINGFNVTLAQLKNVGSKIVDLHGPHSHQMLFSEASHIEILDKLSDIKQKISDYLSSYHEYISLKRDLSNLQELSFSSERELETLAFQIKELEQVTLNKENYETILQESSLMANSEKLYETASSLMKITGDENNGISEKLREAFKIMRSLLKTDPEAGFMSEILERMQDDCSTFSAELSEYLDKISFSSARSNEINRKYDIYYDILRKYGPSIDDAVEFYKKCRSKYDLLADIEHNTSGLTERLGQLEPIMNDRSRAITHIRKKTAKNLKDTIESELKDLGMPHVSFACLVEKSAFTTTGSDKVSFQISPNAGEPLRPLAEIVSSGEAARVMLALKKALIKVDPVPCLIFDEVDSHIGGRLGAIIGSKLKEISNTRQVLLITHLPQIASFGSGHIKIYKKLSSGRTVISADYLEGSERTEEIAKMMSGEKKSRIAVTHAEDMLESAKGSS